jgi:hypothetical protein
MRKPLRVAIKALERVGLSVSHVTQGGLHTALHLRDGRIVHVSKGNRVGPNFEAIARNQAKKLARQGHVAA